ncbi:MAG TPA: hypothetical protein VG096_19020 [Bryobacteraceae bacterium]|jgi:hypothetical protein|nr:hypothetical protein [Bryobacteraceae bacterium]
MNALSEFDELLVAVSFKCGQAGCEHVFPPLLFCVLQELLVAGKDFDGEEPY